MRIERKFLFALSAILLWTNPDLSYAYMAGDTCNDSPSQKCGPQIISNVQAPVPSITKGFRLPKKIKNLLLNSFPSVSPRFVDNNSTQEIYLSQATEGELRAFFNYSVPGLSFSYAVMPTTYSAKPSYCSGAWDESMQIIPEKTIDISLPQVGYSLTAPVIINRYTRLNGTVSNPAETTMMIGNTNINSQVKFTYSRQDCSEDGISNKRCNEVSFMEAQQIVFSAVASNDTYIWDISNPAMTSRYYVSLNNGAYQPLEDCSASYAPAIDGFCGLANGQRFAEVSPKGLCASGKSSRVEKSFNRWEWTCRGVSGGASAKCSAAAPR